LAIVAYMSVISNVNAATKEEIEDTIVKGLAWLATQQKADGSWWFGPSAYPAFDSAVTGLVVLKFVERAIELKLDPFGADYPYAANVIAGFIGFRISNGTTYLVTGPRQIRSKNA